MQNGQVITFQITQLQHLFFFFNMWVNVMPCVVPLSYFRPKFPILPIFVSKQYSAKTELHIHHNRTYQINLKKVFNFMNDIWFF